MKSPAPSDPLRAHCLELCEELAQHVQALRDYALTPGNVWLAKNELQQAGQTLSELEALLAEIKLQDQAQ